MSCGPGACDNLPDRAPFSLPLHSHLFPIHRQCWFFNCIYLWRVLRCEPNISVLSCSQRTCFRLSSWTLLLVGWRVFSCLPSFRRCILHCWMYNAPPRWAHSFMDHQSPCWFSWFPFSHGFLGGEPIFNGSCHLSWVVQAVFFICLAGIWKQNLIFNSLAYANDLCIGKQRHGKWSYLFVVHKYNTNTNTIQT